MSSTGYYKRIYDTEVSGLSLKAGLTGDDVRALEMSAALANPIPFVVGTDTSLSAQQWIQAVTRSQAIDAGVLGSISLGPDATSQAASYVNLFNLRSTNDTRILRFFLSDQAATNSATNVSLRNTSGTANSVIIALDAAANGVANASTQVLFTGIIGPNLVTGTGATAACCAGKEAGSERIVTVYANNLTIGSESVTFNILGASL